MSHERQDIREAIVTALSGETDADGRVSATRLAPQRADQLPAISVYTDSEEIDQATWSSAPRELKRTMQVAIEAWARVTADLDNTLDALALDIETAMDADETLGGKAGDSVLSSTEIQMSMDGDRPIGVVRLVYAVTYHTDLRIQPPEDKFDVAQIRYNLANEIEVDDEVVDDVSGINQEE